MKTSEKVILSLCLVSAIYAVVDFSLSRQKKKAVVAVAGPQTQAQAQTQIEPQVASPGLTELNGKISALSSPQEGKVDRLAILINESWQTTLFVPHRVDFGIKKEVEKPVDVIDVNLQAAAEKMVYSGFLAMGGERIAIINGMDYRIGEQVDGFTVTAITADAIQVSQRESTFTVPATFEKSGEPVSQP